MNYHIYLFDMDGVLLSPYGYHTSLQNSVKRIGSALGAPQAELSDDQIAKLESLTITNEWDSLAICTSIILLHAWRKHKDIRLDGLSPNNSIYISEAVDFDGFIDSIQAVGNLPCHSIFEKIVGENPMLTPGQMQHLQTILLQNRNIYTSPTLPVHQETVLGSQRYSSNYNLIPRLNTESFLIKYDRPNLTDTNKSKLQAWMNEPENLMGILTNRPSSTPPGYLSSPEAEIGAELLGLEKLPILGSGMLAWYAATQCELPDYTFLKPHPVHALGLLQMCLGKSKSVALENAVNLWLGHGAASDWRHLDQAEVTIFEDSVKGLQSGRSAQELLRTIDIHADFNLVGVTKNQIKKKALESLAHSILPDINHIRWE